MKTTIKYPVSSVESLKKLAKRVAKDEGLSLAAAQEALARRLGCSDWHQSVTSLEGGLELAEDGPREPEADPAWLTPLGVHLLREGPLLPQESVAAMYRRVARAASELLGLPGVYRPLLVALRSGHISPSVAVLTALGTDRLPPLSFGRGADEAAIADLDSRKDVPSCSLSVADAEQSEKDGLSNGVARDFTRRLNDYLSTNLPGSRRRGSAAVYYPAGHPDRYRVLQTLSRNQPGFYPCFTFSNKFMKSIDDGTASESDQDFWNEVMLSRLKYGFPGVLFEEASGSLAGDRLRRIYGRHGLKNRQGGLTTADILPSGVDFSSTTCLASMAAHRFDDWREGGAVRLLVFLMEAFWDDYLQKSDGLAGHERTRNFVGKSRALNIGVFGYHSLLQRRGLAFDSRGASALNRELFSHIRDEAEAASRELATLRGEPEWCKGEGVRHTHLVSLNPTRNSSLLQGVSDGVSAISSNLIIVRMKGGSETRQNHELKKLLARLGKDTENVWASIQLQAGSVQHLDFLSKEQKNVFRTAYEIDQTAVIKAAAERAPYVDQGQAIILYLDSDWAALIRGESTQETAKRTPELQIAHRLHMEAWKAGLKSLYFLRVGPSRRTGGPSSAAGLSAGLAK